VAVEHIKLSLLKSFLSFLPLVSWVLNTLTLAHTETGVGLDALFKDLHSSIYTKVVLTHITVKLSIFIVGHHAGR